MNTATAPARSAKLFLVASNEGHTPNAEIPDDSLRLWSLGMEQAIEIEKVSLATLACLNSCTIEIFKNAWWFAPVLVPGVSRTVESSSGGQPTEDELAYAMDIAIGEQYTVPRSTVTSISSGQAQPTEELPESGMEIAIMARAA